MGRWDIDDDARSSTSSQPEVSRDARSDRDAAPEVRELPDRLPSRARDRARDEREHDLTLPSGPDREAIHNGADIYRLRGSEVDLLESAARYRCVFTEDLRSDAQDEHRFDHDLRSLERQGLVEEQTISRLRDGRVADVVAVTPRGKALLDHHRDLDRDRGQAYYGGWVKPRERWHDAAQFRMVREMERELSQDGRRIRRVILDDELKANLHRSRHKGSTGRDHAGRDEGPGRVHTEDGRAVLPDVRLEVEEPDGSVRYVDLELVTEHYHRGHVGGKASAGFRMFRSGSSGRGGTPRDEHRMSRLLR